MGFIMIIFFQEYILKIYFFYQVFICSYGFIDSSQFVLKCGLMYQFSFEK